MFSGFAERSALDMVKLQVPPPTRNSKHSCVKVKDKEVQREESVVKSKKEEENVIKGISCLSV